MNNNEKRKKFYNSTIYIIFSSFFFFVVVIFFSDSLSLFICQEFNDKWQSIDGYKWNMKFIENYRYFTLFIGKKNFSSILKSHHLIYRKKNSVGMKENFLNIGNNLLARIHFNLIISYVNLVHSFIILNIVLHTMAIEEKIERKRKFNTSLFFASIDFFTWNRKIQILILWLCMYCVLLGVLVLYIWIHVI